jgi:hypothetical protein
MPMSTTPAKDQRVAIRIADQHAMRAVAVRDPAADDLSLGGLLDRTYRCYAHEPTLGDLPLDQVLRALVD